MNKYQAWIKELSPIVYDNSKSEYQIICELIPILVEFSNTQNTFSEDMDTFYNELNTKISSLIDSINTGKETINNLMSSFTENLPTEFNKIIAEINELKTNFVNKITPLMSNFNETYNNAKNEITTNISSQSEVLLNSITTGYNGIITKLNNFAENYINDNEAVISNIFISTIKGKYDSKVIPKFLYTTINYMQSETPTGASGEIWYNTTNNLLYEYNTDWVEKEILLNTIYRFNNKLYTYKLVANKTKLFTGSYIGYSNNTYCFVDYGSSNLYYLINNGVSTKYTINSTPSDYQKIATGTGMYFNRFAYFNDEIFLIYKTSSMTYKIMKSNNYVDFVEVNTAFTFLQFVELFICDNKLYLNTFYKKNTLIYQNNNFEDFGMHFLGKKDNLYYQLVFNGNLAYLYEDSDIDFANKTQIGNIATSTGQPSPFIVTTHNKIVGNYDYMNNKQCLCDGKINNYLYYTYNLFQFIDDIFYNYTPFSDNKYTYVRDLDAIINTANTCYSVSITGSLV